MSIIIMALSTLASRFGPGGFGFASNVARALLNGTSNTAGYVFHVILQLYANGVGLSSDRPLPRTPPFLAMNILTYGLLEITKDLLSPPDVTTRFDPEVSSVWYKAVYTVNVIHITMSNIVVAVALTGGFSQGARWWRGEPSCWRAVFHPYPIVAFITFTGAIAIALQPYGYDQFLFVVAPLGVIAWFTIAYGCTHRRDVLSKRAFVVLVGVTAAGGVAIGSSALFGLMRNTSATGKLGVSAMFSLLVFFLLQSAMRVASASFAEDHFAALMMILMFESAFGEFFFLVVEPFTLGYGLVLASQTVKGLLLALDSPKLILACVRGSALQAAREAVDSTVNHPPEARLRAMSAMIRVLEGAALRAARRWRYAQQALFTELVAIIVVPLAAGLDLLFNRLDVGRSRLMPKLSTPQRRSLLLSYAVIMVVQAFVFVVVTTVHARRLRALNSSLQAEYGRKRKVQQQILQEAIAAKAAPRAPEQPAADSPAAPASPPRAGRDESTDRLRILSSSLRVGYSPHAGFPATKGEPKQLTAPPARSDASKVEPVEQAGGGLLSDRRTRSAVDRINPLMAMRTAAERKRAATLSHEPRRRLKRVSILDEHYSTRDSTVQYWRRHEWLFAFTMVQVLCAAVVEVSHVETRAAAE